MPRFVSEDIVVLRHDESVREQLLTLVNVTGAALNWLHAGGRARPFPTLTSAAQRSVARRLADRWSRLLLSEASKGPPPTLEAAWESLVQRATGSNYAPFVAMKVDMCWPSGQVDACNFVDEESVKFLGDPRGALLPGVSAALVGKVKYIGESRSEYLCFVRRQLRARKLVLRSGGSHAARVFAVGKTDRDSLREVRDGSRISRSLLKAPKPPLQATPHSLSLLESSDEARCA